MKANRAQLAKIHIARKELGLDDETYRQVLQEITGKRSAAEISAFEAGRLLDHFRARGWAPRKKARGEKSRRYEDLGERAGMASPKQLRKIEAMWREIAWGDPHRSLRRFLFKGWQCSDLRFLTARQAYDVTEAVKAMIRRRAG